MDPLFKVKVVAQMPSPQRCVYIALHQDYSEGFSVDEPTNKTEEEYGEIAIKRLLNGNRGHFGALEHPQIILNAGWFPHSVMQQARTHRAGCCLAGDTLISFGHPSLSPGELSYKKRIAELASLWHEGRRHQRGRADAAYMQRMINSRAVLRANEETECVEPTRITNIYRNGLRHVFHFSFEGGCSITATKDHLVLTPSGWRTFGDLKSGDPVYVSGAFGRRVVPTQPVISRDEALMEQWLPVKDYEWYEVSNLGRVRSWAPRKHRGVLKYPASARLKKQSESDYLYVSLSKADGSGSKRFNVHTLVLQAFKGEKPEGQVCRHLNGNHYDNRLSNLEWGTEAANAADRAEHDVIRRSRLRAAAFIGLEDRGMQETFDLEVEGPFHNFIANNIVVHNSWDVQSGRYTGQRIVKVVNSIQSLDLSNQEHRDQLEDVFYLRPVGEHRDRQGKRYTYTEEQREADLEECFRAANKYAEKLELGYSEEHARGMLPFDTRQHFVVSFNCRSLMHFLDLRAKADAQQEIRHLCELMFVHFKAWMPEIAEWYYIHRWGKANLAP